MFLYLWATLQAVQGGAHPWLDASLFPLRVSLIFRSPDSFLVSNHTHRWKEKLRESLKAPCYMTCPKACLRHLIQIKSPKSNWLKQLPSLYKLEFSHQITFTIIALLSSIHLAITEVSIHLVFQCPQRQNDISQGKIQHWLPEKCKKDRSNYSHHYFISF